jgi:predicted alternative tryptophan synthase beta-subunit
MLEMGPKWGRPTPLWRLQKLKFLCQASLKILFTMAKYFVEMKYAKFKVNMQLEKVKKCKK